MTTSHEAPSPPESPMPDRPAQATPEATDEHVTPARASQRLYDEMALAYREQADDDLATAERHLPAAREALGVPE